MSAGLFMHWFFSLLAVCRRIVAVCHTGGLGRLALGLLCCQSVLAWAGAAGVSHQLYLDSDGQQQGGCTAAASVPGGLAAGFEFRLQVDLDAHGEPLPARWSVCQGGAFVEAAPSSPIEVLASSTLPGPVGLGGAGVAVGVPFWLWAAWASCWWRHPGKAVPGPRCQQSCLW